MTPSVESLNLGANRPKKVEEYPVVSSKILPNHPLGRLAAFIVFMLILTSTPRISWAKLRLVFEDGSVALVDEWVIETNADPQGLLAQLVRDQTINQEQPRTTPMLFDIPNDSILPVQVPISQGRLFTEFIYPVLTLREGVHIENIDAKNSI